MVKLIRLQQLTGGHLPTDDGDGARIDSGKMKLLADTLEDIGSDEPTVVFCRYHADFDVVHEACDANGYTTMELSRRRSQLSRWQNGEAQVLPPQINAGGIGVDLSLISKDEVKIATFNEHRAMRDPTLNLSCTP